MFVSLMDEKLEAGLEKAAIATAERHLFLCMGPDCCTRKEAEELWEVIKKRIKQTGVKAMRTKAECFRICTGGPWIVVYPEGVWYGEMTEKRFERVLQEHLLGGTPVEEWVVARNDLARVTREE